MSKLTRIPPSEWVVMEVLWRESPLSASEIFERLDQSGTVEGDWTTKTVRAFLDRLLQKTAVSRRKIHGIYVFEPLLRREDSLLQESRSFLERFFQGNPVSVISHFVETEELSPADIARIQRMLQEQENARKEHQNE